MSNIEKIRQEIERQMRYAKDAKYPKGSIENERATAIVAVCLDLLSFIDSLSQEQQMPDSTQLIAEWEREKAVLEQKDFRGDAERMAYNAFLDGFVKGIGYGCTK